MCFYSFPSLIGITFFGGKVDDGYVCSFLGIQDRYRPADTRVSPSDQGDLAFELGRGFVMCSSVLRRGTHFGFKTGPGLVLRWKWRARIITGFCVGSHLVILTHSRS